MLDPPPGDVVLTIPLRKLPAIACLLALHLLFWQDAVLADEREELAGEEDWVSLPESDRSTFVGVHGGTVPVSILSSEKHAVKAAVPGRTEQDFVAAVQGTGDSDPQDADEDLVPFGLADTPTVSGDTHLARLNQEPQSSKPRGAVRLKVDDLKVVPVDAPVTPESLLIVDELSKM